MNRYNIYAEIGICLNAVNKQDAKNKFYKLLGEFNIHYHEIEVKEENKATKKELEQNLKDVKGMLE